MVDNSITRRDFLRLGGLALGGLALPPLGPWLPPGGEANTIGQGRVATTTIASYERASYRSQRNGWLFRDQILPLLEEVYSLDGPLHNPLWYRIAGGYVHSMYIQRVEGRRLNPLLESIPATGILAEVTVPFTQTYRYTVGEGWQPLYRLHYESTHWITGLDEGPDGQPWYRLTDHYPTVDYHVPATHLRPIPPEEYAPLAPDVPADEKRIVISISRQQFTAYEGERIVLHNSISSGAPSINLKPGDIPTDTPTGSFRVSLKMPSRHMGEARLTSDPEAYELPGVPWVMVFHEIGAALHGAFWHDNFGARMSHGCVNLRNRDAKWLFRWADPVFDPANWYMMGAGTRVIVEE